MTRPKQKREESENERLHKENRELKTTIRSLMKRLKKVDREYAKEVEDENHERALEENYTLSADRPKPCGHCGKGKIVSVDIVGRKFQRCDTCDWKSGRKV